MQTDQDFRLELTTIARLLCLKPDKLRAVKLDLPIPIYRIEKRIDDSVLSFILFQPVSKALENLKQCPVKKLSIKAAAKIAAENQKPLFILYNWLNQHFGLIKGGDFFELDSWPSPKNNPEILLPNPKDLLILYEIKDKESIKISVNSII
jgi:hypothetical protein